VQLTGRGGGGCGLSGSNSQPLGVILFPVRGPREARSRAAGIVDRGAHVSIVRFLRVMIGRTFGKNRTALPGQVRRIPQNRSLARQREKDRNKTPEQPHQRIHKTKFGACFSARCCSFPNIHFSTAPSCACSRLPLPGPRGRPRGAFPSPVCPSPACPWLPLTRT
jgi:hypothetical protein